MKLAYAFRKEKGSLGILGALRHNSKLVLSGIIQMPRENRQQSDRIFRVCPTPFYPRFDRVFVSHGRDQFSSGQFMDKLYFGLGAALYLLFVVWCISTPQK